MSQMKTWYVTVMALAPRFVHKGRTGLVPSLREWKAARLPDELGQGGSMTQLPVPEGPSLYAPG